MQCRLVPRAPINRISEPREEGLARGHERHLVRHCQAYLADSGGTAALNETESDHLKHLFDIAVSLWSMHLSDDSQDRKIIPQSGRIDHN